MKILSSHPRTSSTGAISACIRLLARRHFRIWFLLSVLGSLAVADVPVLRLPLDGTTHLSVGNAEVEQNGPHRFIKIGGRVGYQPLSLATQLRLPTEVHRGPRGTVIMWVCPLETLSVASQMDSFMSQDPLAQEYPLVSDTWPVKGGVKSNHRGGAKVDHFGPLCGVG